MVPPRLPWLLAACLCACGGDRGQDARTAEAKKAPASRDVRPGGSGDGEAGAPEAVAPAPAPAGASSGSAPAPAGDAPPPLPCEVRWDDGTRVRIQATERGGSAFLDEDGDGENDTCATFKLAPDDPPGGITYLRLDEGCDREAEQVVRAKPREGGLWRITVESGGTIRTLVGLPLPLPLPAAPYYLLDGSPGAYAVTRACGRIVEVARKSAPRRRVVLRPRDEDCGEAGAPAGPTRLEDDIDGDGTTDVTLDLSYDGAGRLSSIVRADERGAVTAKVRYDCG